MNLRFVVFSAHLRPYLMHLPRWQRLTMGYFTGALTYVLFVKRYTAPGADEAARTAQIASLANTPLRWIAATVSAAAAVAAYALPLKLNILVGIAVAVVVCLELERRVRP